MSLIGSVKGEQVYNPVGHKLGTVDGLQGNLNLLNRQLS